MIEVKNIKQQKGIFITAGIVLLSLFAVFIADSFYPFGSGSVAALDLNSQYLPLLYRFYDIVTGLSTTNCLYCVKVPQHENAVFMNFST